MNYFFEIQIPSNNLTAFVTHIFYLREKNAWHNCKNWSLRFSLYGFISYHVLNISNKKLSIFVPRYILYSYIEPENIILCKAICLTNWNMTFLAHMRIVHKMAVIFRLNFCNVQGMYIFHRLPFHHMIRRTMLKRSSNLSKHKLKLLKSFLFNVKI